MTMEVELGPAFVIPDELVGRMDHVTFRELVVMASKKK
jgi:hypothetical protein